MQIFPAGVIAPMRASGGCAPVSLVEVQTLSGGLHYWADTAITVKPVIGDPNTPVAFLPWVIGVPTFHTYRTLQTDIGQMQIQNLSGTSYDREVANIFSAEEFEGAMLYYRIWNSAAEFAIYEFAGNILDPTIDERLLQFTVAGFGNWSAIEAPYFILGENCPLTFASPQCGSTAATPCAHTLATCTALERFMGVPTQLSDPHTGTTTPPVIAQPAPRLVVNRVRNL